MYTRINNHIILAETTVWKTQPSPPPPPRLRRSTLLSSPARESRVHACCALRRQNLAKIFQAAESARKTKTSKRKGHRPTQSGTTVQSVRVGRIPVANDASVSLLWSWPLAPGTSGTTHWGWVGIQFSVLFL